MPNEHGAADAPWWVSGVLYQIYPRSFADTDGDGMGDLPGIIDHLDHLEWLGIDGVWISPITRSPNADWGYDVSDFCAIEPDLGTLDDVDRLIAEAARRGIRVLMDLVPNHTSDQHPWFLDSRSSRQSEKRDWYVWADATADGSPPNNWVSSFGGPAWTADQATGQSYLHNHLSAQPDLNWWNEEVRAAFDEIMEFWLARGVAGFRIDVCNVIIKDAALRDNPAATEDDDFEAQLFGQRAVYNTNRPEVHDVIRRWRALVDTYPEPKALLGETPVAVPELAAYYGDGRDELHLAFNFPFISSPVDPDALRAVVEQTEAALPPGAWPVWTGSNHDMFRFPTRWADDDPRKVRAALLMLLSLRGTPFLYQGDEIGLGNTKLTEADMRDPLGVRYWPYYEGRDAGRTPMPWRDVSGGGFTAPGVRPWLPLGDVHACNVEDQRADPGSVLNLTRALIGLRRQEADLHAGAYRARPAPPGVWAWSRGARHFVVINMADAATSVPDVAGTVRIGTLGSRAGEVVDGTLELGPWEGIIGAALPPGSTGR
jgi:alpha-glucosidase